MPELRKVTVTEQDASGFGFGDFTFSAPGTYAYTVTEEQAGQTVDGLSHAAPARIIFSVMDNGLGGYSVGRTVTGIQQDTFVNAYRPTPIQVAAPAELRKELRAPAWDDGLTFSFNLTDVSTDADGAPLAPTLPQWEGTGSGTSALPAPPVCDVGGRRCTVGVGKPESGMVTPIDFGVFTFTGAGTYRYAITEIDESPLQEGIYYDAHAATLTITVTDDGDGTLTHIWAYRAADGCCAGWGTLGAMHVITGRFKGTPLATPLSVTRPTMDRTKEALFSRLEARGLLEDARVLDLFGGTGALGIEALSRGARDLVVVEANAQAAKLIAATLTSLKRHPGWRNGMSAHVVRAKAERYAAKASVDTPFDVILIDPPYAFATDGCERLLDDLVSRGLVGEDGVIVLERSKRTTAPAAPRGWYEDDRRDYGETTVYTYRSDAYARTVAQQDDD